MRRTLLAALAAIPVGVLLGTAGQEAEHYVRELRWVAGLGVPWLAVSWAVGALAGRSVAGAVAGAVSLTVATLTYYVLFIRGSATLAILPVAIGWSLASVAAGGLFGLAGGAWRSASVTAVRVGAVALLAGALAGEALLLASEWPGPVARTLLVAELAAAAALPFLLVRPVRALPAALAVTAVAALVLGVAEHEVRESMRAAGWKGL